MKRSAFLIMVAVVPGARPSAVFMIHAVPRRPGRKGVPGRDIHPIISGFFGYHPKSAEP